MLECDYVMMDWSLFSNPLIIKVMRVIYSLLLPTGTRS